jgi:hypothetical protein
MLKLFCVLNRVLLLFCLAGMLANAARAQALDCTFKPPLITIHFGSGEDIRDPNTVNTSDYERVRTSCPSDGYYTYTDYTSECFRGDWLTLEDHTPGDKNGNMMLVNASYSTGVFFGTNLMGLKGGTTYEFALWMMNVCRISDKCPFPLLPNIIIRLKTPAGRTVAQFGTGELPRLHAPHWTRYRAVFTMPAGETALVLSMADSSPGGCGNDFVLDDITIRECMQPLPAVTTAPVKTPAKKPAPAATKPVVRKETPAPVKTAPRITTVDKKTSETTLRDNPLPKEKTALFAPPPPILLTRANPLIKQIETESGSIKIDLYDNGEIDGDTVSVYHNNELVVSRAKLSQKPISIRVAVDAAHPHHELIMVAHNLGSIPPNTSLMIVTTESKKYQVFISSTEQKNAKVVIDLRE